MKMPLCESSAWLQRCFCPQLACRMGGAAAQLISSRSAAQPGSAVGRRRSSCQMSSEVLVYTCRCTREAGASCGMTSLVAAGGLPAQRPRPLHSVALAGIRAFCACSQVGESGSQEASSR
jgi:hypothetical protein